MSCGCPPGRHVSRLNTISSTIRMTTQAGGSCQIVSKKGFSVLLPPLAALSRAQKKPTTKRNCMASNTSFGAAGTRECPGFFTNLFTRAEPAAVRTAPASRGSPAPWNTLIRRTRRLQAMRADISSAALRQVWPGSRLIDYVRPPPQVFWRHVRKNDVEPAVPGRSPMSLIENLLSPRSPLHKPLSPGKAEGCGVMSVGRPPGRCAPPAPRA